MNYKKAKGNLTFSLNYNYEDLGAAANLPPVQLFFKEVNKIYIVSLLHFKVEAFTFEKFKIWPVFFLYVMQPVNMREMEQLIKVDCKVWFVPPKHFKGIAGLKSSLPLFTTVWNSTLTCFRPNTEVHKQICILSWQLVDLSISNLYKSISLSLFMSYLPYHQTKAVSYALQIIQRKVTALESPKSKVISTIKWI